MRSFLSCCCSDKDNDQEQPPVPIKSKEHDDRKSNRKIFNCLADSLCCCFCEDPYLRMVNQHIAELRASEKEEPPSKVSKLRWYKRQQTWNIFRVSIFHTRLVGHLTRCGEIFRSLDERLGCQLCTLKFEVLLLQPRIRIRASVALQSQFSRFNENPRFDIMIYGLDLQFLEFMHVELSDLVNFRLIFSVFFYL